MLAFPHLNSHDLIGLISKSFQFERVDPPLPQLANMGLLRIIGVMINEDSEPELCLRDESSPDSYDEIFPISHLKVDANLFSLLATLGQGH